MTKVLNTLSAIGAIVMAATPLIAAASFAHAQDAVLQPQPIRVADLDLGRPADVARFNARVELAAGRMCASYGDMTVNAACRQAIRTEAGQKLQALRVQSAQTPADQTVAFVGR